MAKNRANRGGNTDPCLSRDRRHTAVSTASGDRHLRAEPSGRLGAPPQRAATVLVSANPAYAATAAGQHLLHMCVNLLARQFGAVQRILIEVPPLQLQDQIILGPRTADDLCAALVGTVSQVGGGEIIAAPASQADSPDAAVLIGPELDPS